MSTLRAAAQQALEALQELNGWQSLAPPAASRAAVQAAINLSAALAEEALQRLTNVQQEMERNFCPRCGKGTTTLHTCTPPGAHHGPV